MQRLATLGWVFGVFASTASAAAPGLGEWLLDLGRDYPLSAQAGASDADAMITLLLMQAATRIDPQLTEGYYWQYDMQLALGREDEARAAIAQYVRSRPEDAAAQLRWIESALAKLQTSEERATFCRQYMKREGLPSSTIGDLHRQLAEYHWNRAESGPAAEHAKAALQADPFNFLARQLLQAIEHRENDAASRLELALWLLRVNPADAPAAQRVGEILVDAGMPREAGPWFEHAIALSRMLPPGRPPVSLSLSRVRASIASQDLGAAKAELQKVLEVDPENIEARLVEVRLATLQADRATAQAAIDRITVRWRTMMATGEPVPPRTLAELAWTLIHDMDDAAQAMSVARALIEEPSARVVARRALGAAQLRAKQWDAARLTLEPVAGSDEWSSLLLAQALLQVGDKPGADQRLRTLATQPVDAELAGDLRRVATAAAIEMPTTQPAPRVLADLLSAFPRELLDYPAHPDKYLSAIWSIEPREPGPGDPWVCTLELKNKGSFPIVIGPAAMLAPEVLCSLQARGDQERSSGPTLRVVLHGPSVLKPGETLRTKQNLLVGPLRASMIGTPQVTHQVELTSVLNPLRLVDAQGRDTWAPAPGGFVIETLKFTRAGVVATAEQVRTLLGESQSSDVSTRLKATRLLAMLLAESQHLSAGRLKYAVRKVDAVQLQAAVLARVGDTDATIRAHVAEMARWIVLDKAVTKAFEPLVNDGNWLVRGLISRALTDHKAEAFKSVLSNRSRGDGDEWVRRLSSALQQRAVTPDSRPAEAAPAASRPASTLPPAAKATPGDIPTAPPPAAGPPIALPQ